MNTANDVVGSYELAYASVLPDAMALEEKRLAHPTTDAESLSHGVFAKLGALAEIRPRVAALPEFGLYDYDQLGLRVRAFCHAESNFRMAERDPPAFRTSLSVLDDVKEQLLGECTLLVHHRCLQASTLHAFKFTNQRRRNVAMVRHLIVHLRANWPHIRGHTRLTLAQLGEMLTLADDVYTELARDYVADSARRSAADIRKRIFTLVDMSLDEVGRAVDFLFRKDKPQIKRHMPQCYPNRGRRTRTASGVEQPEP